VKSTNIIKAIINVVTDPVLELMAHAESHNRANNMGEALEEYIKDIFAGSVRESDEASRNKMVSECFSYLGNQNNPPDSIIRNGDAIEVKKIEGDNSALALNSSYPKAKLFSNIPMLSNSCKNCEEWAEKDMIFAVGVCKNYKLSSLALVYGIDYAASHDVYERIKDTISNGVNSIPDVEFSETKELGRVNRVDPLGITYLRIRGMWGIENPFQTFKYIYQRDENKRFNFMALINEDKYNSFSECKELENLVGKIEGLKIDDVEIKVPDNPANLKKAKLISFYC
jgi:hypothetical protein